MLDRDQVASAVEEYLNETYKPLATCMVQVANRGGRWEVDAALVQPGRSKFALERYLLTLNRDGKVTGCTLRGTAPLEPIGRRS